MEKFVCERIVEGNEICGEDAIVLFGLDSSRPFTLCRVHADEYLREHISNVRRQWAEALSSNESKHRRSIEEDAADINFGYQKRIDVLEAYLVKFGIERSIK